MTDMRIVKVVVTELPEKCWDCPFPFGGNDHPGWQCSIMEMVDNSQVWDISDESRPTWCPLVKQKDGEE